ncbi:MAG: CD225/dispanin family protein [Planctomycetaceae bacterium]|nr:CD225/dispanin family protein [Planctomycetaceae bacterium]
MNCSLCGVVLPDDAKFCVNCGNPAAADSPQSPNSSCESAPRDCDPQYCNRQSESDVPDYLVWSIFTTILCQPFGIAAIVFSVLTMLDKDRGRYDSAIRNSQRARTMVNTGLILAIVFVIVLLIGRTIIWYKMMPNEHDRIFNGIRRENMLVPPIPIPSKPMFYNSLPPEPITTIDTHNWLEKGLGEIFQLRINNHKNPALFDSINIKITVRVHNKDNKKFDNVFATKSEKIRAIIYDVLREAAPKEIDSPTMSSIRQKIMEQINEELQLPIIKDVLCTEISTSTS